MTLPRLQSFPGIKAATGGVTNKITLVQISAKLIIVPSHSQVSAEPRKDCHMVLAFSISFSLYIVDYQSSPSTVPS